MVQETDYRGQSYGNVDRYERKRMDSKEIQEEEAIEFGK